jgi:hypothetical protein
MNSHWIPGRKPAERTAEGAGIDGPLARYRGLPTSYPHANGLGSITHLGLPYPQTSELSWQIGIRLFGWGDNLPLPKNAGGQ